MSMLSPEHITSAIDPLHAMIALLSELTRTEQTPAGQLSPVAIAQLRAAATSSASALNGNLFHLLVFSIFLESQGAGALASQVRLLVAEIEPALSAALFDDTDCGADERLARAAKLLGVAATHSPQERVPAGERLPPWATRSSPK